MEVASVSRPATMPTPPNEGSTAGPGENGDEMLLPVIAGATVEDGAIVANAERYERHRRAPHAYADVREDADLGLLVELRTIANKTENDPYIEGRLAFPPERVDALCERLQEMKTRAQEQADD